jgi:hypothetical protein
MESVDDPQKPASGGLPQRVTLVEWAKTPEAQASWMRILEEANTRPPIYCPSNKPDSKV